MSKISELEVGQVIATADYQLSRDTLVRYAGASGDFNPIHYRDSVAESVGLPGVLAHGMLTMGFAIQPVVDWLGDPGKILDYQVRFTRPVVVHPDDGARVQVSAKIAQLDETENTAKIELQVVYAEKTVLGKAFAVVKLS